MTVIGKDRTGLVESIAKLVAEHGANWLESRMCRLGGDFAGILRVEVPADRRAALEQALAGFRDLNIVVRSDKPHVPQGAPKLVALEVIGPDRPGIVREITAALASQRVNVEELATECLSAPMTGELLFQARARLLLPAGSSVAALRKSLESAASALAVDFTLSEDV